MVAAPFTVFDYRKDIRNIIVSPEIRGRFLRMEPVEVGPWHSHDVGHEIFLVLDGVAEFEIAGHTQLVGPGQLCIAWAGEKHEVRTHGDQPMTLFLAVTPHLEPTHTFWSRSEEPLPPHYASWTVAGLADQPAPVASLTALATRVVAATRQFSTALDSLTGSQQRSFAALAAAESMGDKAAIKPAIDAVWPDMRATYVRMRELEQAWNDLTLRLAGEQSSYPMPEKRDAER